MINKVLNKTLSRNMFLIFALIMARIMAILQAWMELKYQESDGAQTTTFLHHATNQPRMVIFSQRKSNF